MGHGYRPVICKIEIKNPNKKGTKKANKNFLHYIATREGVDLTRIDTLMDAVHENYDLTEDGEMVAAAEASDEEYLRYMSFRPRSHGLFGNIDTENFADVSKKLDAVSDGKRVVYRGVISLSELDGRALGYNNSKIWALYLRSVMPDISNTLGLGTDVTWVAAFHAEQSHPHVHFMLWDNKDNVKNAFITKSQHLKCREICQNAMFTEENEAVIRQVTEAERKELYSLQNASRNEILEYFGKVFKISRQEDVPGALMEEMPGRLSAGEHDSLKELYKKVLETLPDHGRLMYKFMPPECKGNIDRITEIFLRRADISAEYERYICAVNEIHKLLGKTSKEIKQQREKSIEELYNRTGNIVLKGVLQIRDNILNDDDRAQDDVLKNREGQGTDNDKEIYLDRNDRDVSTPGRKSYFQLGKIYSNKEDEMFDYGKAVSYFKMSMDSEENSWAVKEAKLRLSRIYSDQESGFCDYQEAALLLEGEEDDTGRYALQLGRIYAEEENPEHDMEKAVLYLRESAEKGNVSAKYSLGKMLVNQNSGVYSLDEGISILEEAAQGGFEPAMLKLGAVYADAGDFGKAEEWLNSALAECEGKNKEESAENFGRIYYRLGRIYENREAGQLNYGKAAEFYEKSIEWGGWPARESRLRLSRIYADTDGGICDYRKAAELLEDVGDDTGRYALQLGRIYAEEENPDFDMEKAVLYFRESAEKGNVLGKYRLGSLLADKHSELYSMKESIRLLQEAAEEGFEPAMLKLGSIYSSADCEEKDFDKAEEWLYKALGGAEGGNGEKNAGNSGQAYYRLGRIYENKDAGKFNYEKAAEFYKKSIEREGWSAKESRLRLSQIYGDSEGILCDWHRAAELLEGEEDDNGRYALQLGRIYAEEENPEHDMEKAVLYLRESAEKGNIIGKYRLGSLLADMRSEFYSFEEGRGFLQDAAEEGFVPAMLKLGAVYSNENCEDRNFQEAEKWLNRALMEAEGKEGESPGSSAQAYYRLGRIYGNKDAEQYDSRKAAEFYKKAMISGKEGEWASSESRLRLSQIYADKESGLYDCHEAAELLKYERDDDGKYALQLGRIYADEGNPDYDMKKAVKYFDESAEKGNLSGKYRLGSLLADPDSGFYNLKKGINLLKDAAGEDFIPAMLKLGTVYSSAKCAERDFQKAEEWLYKALEKSQCGVREDAESSGQAYYRLAKIYENMEAEQFDCWKAVEFYEKSMERGGWAAFESRLRLAGLYADRQKGMCLYQDAVRLLEGEEDDTGRYALQLGRIYADKENPDYDMEKAVQYYKESAQKGCTDGMVKLAQCYRYGMGIDKDKNLARGWLDKAVEMGSGYAEEVIRRINEEDFKNISYSLLRQIFSSMRQTRAKKEMRQRDMEFKTNSRQVRKEEYLHR